MNRCQNEHTDDRGLGGSVDELRALVIRSQGLLEQERTLLAQEIHDDLVQKITVLSLELSLMDGALASEQELSRSKIAEKLKELGQIVAELIQSLRAMKSRLRPKVLDEYGLGAGLEWASADFSKRTGIKYRIKTSRKELPLSPQVTTELYRMFQEVLRNIEKHAQAEWVEIELRQERSHLVLRVSDNGKGMTQEQISSPRSLGLIELRERVLSLRGEVTFTGIAGKGTIVTVKVPRDNSDPP